MSEISINDSTVTRMLKTIQGLRIKGIPTTEGDVIRVYKTLYPPCIPTSVKHNGNHYVEQEKGDSLVHFSVMFDYLCTEGYIHEIIQEDRLEYVLVKKGKERLLGIKR